MGRRVRLVAALAVLVVGGPLLAEPVSADQAAIRVVPVRGQAVGHGLTLNVDVFWAKGGTPGPPPDHGGGPPGSGSVDCTDTNSQAGYAAPFASASRIVMHVNEGTVPGGLSADSALGTAAHQWNQAIQGQGLLSVSPDGTETAPAEDGTSTIGWVRIVPKNVLAATWTWVDSSNQVVEADLFFNTTQPWVTLTSCPSSPTGKFDVADIATHEMGHVLGLSHYRDSGAQATMYPSAPPDEVRKTSLTAGDVAALQVAAG